MRLSDLLKLAVSNLRRRKTRTVLTVLGVVIGTASIVVMMSLGLGMSKMLLNLYASSGSLTTITVYTFADNGGGKATKVQLTDDTIKDFETLQHVTGTSPSLSVYVQAKSGPYEGSFQINGVSQQYLKELKLSSGEIPKKGQAELSLIYGNQVGPNSFHNTSNFETGIVDPLKDTIFITFPAPQNYSANGVSSGAGGDAGTGGGGSTGGNTTTQSTKPQKKYILQTAGVIAGNADSYSDTSYSVYCDIDTFKTFLKKIYKKALVPEPKTNKNGKPYPYYIYDQAYVFVDDMKNVSTVQKEITDMGYQCMSNMEWLEQSQKTMNMVQMILGGIGAVSLLVAAIGIMNTMMMSIYERTREIGVMKVLGCDMKDIRNMFLFESGMIGLLGGIVGLMLSYGLSSVINLLAGNGGGTLAAFTGGGTGSISYIPFWLAAFAIVFAVCVGSVAGYVPSVRAMKLSPLAAIRNE